MTTVQQLVIDRYAELDGVRIHYVEAGSGPLVVLLHGFPDFWYSWRYQVPALVDAGFRVVAPDMRGYNLSSKPAGLEAYRVELLCRDVALLIDHLGEERAAVIGHDWGGGVAWLFAMLYPERLSKLGVLNLPHPARLLEGMKSPKQLLRSWYMFFFQVPWLPEASIRAGGYRALREVLRHDPVRPGAFTHEDIERYVEAMAQPGALTAAINYYRAMLRRRPAEIRSLLRRIDAPVLVIWGQRDRYLRPELAAPDPSWVPHAQLVRLEAASHWVQHDQPEQVNQLLISFLRASDDDAKITK